MIKWFLSINWKCLLGGHKWTHIGSDGDWLNYGEQIYQCEDCDKTILSRARKA